MKKVKITLINFQSYKEATFSLEGNLQIIWSHGNNVGKSAIFSALEAIVRIQKYSGQEMKSLIRWGEQTSSIICDYDNTHVELRIFLRNSTASYLFLQTENGICTEMTRAPKSLVDALDLMYQEDVDHVLNILEADKTQIIVDETAITDGIMASIFFDSRLEDVKINAADLLKQISADYSYFSQSLAINQRSIGSYSYNPSVDTFNEQKESLKKLALLMDTVPNFKKLGVYSLVRSEEIDDWSRTLNKMQSLLKGIQYLQNVQKITAGVNQGFSDIYSSLMRLYLKLDPLRARDPLTEVIRCISMLQLLSSSAAKIDRYASLQEEISSRYKEIAKLQETIEAHAKMVMCPVKGQVIYGNEKCVPYTK